MNDFVIFVFINCFYAAVVSVIIGLEPLTMIATATLLLVSHPCERRFNPKPL